MGNLICASCRACPEIKGSVTTVAVDHHDELHAGSAAQQQTATAVVTTIPSPSSRPAAAAVTPAASRDASKHRSSAKTDGAHRTINANDATAVTDVDRNLLSPNGINTAWDHYLSPELQACLSHGNSSEDDQQLSDVEKVAKGIVDINIFITSQVIMPALERYLQEMNEQQQQLSSDDIICHVGAINCNDAVSDDDCRIIAMDTRHSDELTICVYNGAGVHLVDRVTMY